MAESLHAVVGCARAVLSTCTTCGVTCAVNDVLRAASDVFRCGDVTSTPAVSDVLRCARADVTPTVSDVLRCCDTTKLDLRVA